MNYKELVLAVSWVVFIMDLTFVTEPMRSTYPYSFLGLAEFFFDESIGRMMFLGITTLGLVVFVILSILSIYLIKLRRGE